MLNEISFKNYKAFDYGKIELKPITILLGANSVGKSSIVQLLLMLQQTSETDNYKSALKLHGEFASLGETFNLLKDKDTSKVLSLSFKFTSPELHSYLKSDGLKQLSASIIESYTFLERFFPENSDLFNKLEIIPKDLNLDRRSFKSFEIKSKQQLLDIINTLRIANDELFAKKKFRESLFFSNAKNYWIFGDRIYNVITSLKEVELTYDFLSSIKLLETKEFEISYDLKCFESKKDTFFKISTVNLMQNNKCILKLEMQPNPKTEEYTNFNLVSDFYRGELLNDRIQSEFEHSVNYNSTIFSVFSDCDSNFYNSENQRISSFSMAIFNILSKAIKSVDEDFDRDKINYVSPLRAHPKRYYFLDKANISTHLDTLSGDSLTEILKDNDSLRAKVNKWLSTFGLSLNIDTLQDIIHRIKIKQNALYLDITDVGFGISQVLPVIVQGFLSQEKSLTIIEQPEIHLHPVMQADLADLFIDIAITKSKKKTSPFKYLLIETHSEYLLKRLRRRIAEGNNINPDQVAIYYFNPRNNSKSGWIERKEISGTGAFDYPKDFYSGELLKDNVEFLKRQIR